MTYESLNKGVKELGFDNVSQALSHYGSKKNIIEALNNINFKHNINNGVSEISSMNADEKLLKLEESIKRYQYATPQENTKICFDSVSHLNGFAKDVYAKFHNIYENYKNSINKDRITILENSQHKIEMLVKLNKEIESGEVKYIDLGRYYLSENGDLFSVKTCTFIKPSVSKGHESLRFYDFKLSTNKLIYWSFNKDKEEINIFDIGYVMKKDSNKPCNYKNLIIKN